jgi:hypothetical protein
MRVAKTIIILTFSPICLPVFIIDNVKYVAINRWYYYYILYVPRNKT